MRNAIKLLTLLGLFGAGITACSKPSSPDQNILIDTNVPADADIEALPPDEGNGVSADEIGNSASNTL